MIYTLFDRVVLTCVDLQLSLVKKHLALKAFCIDSLDNLDSFHSLVNIAGLDS